MNVRLKTLEDYQDAYQRSVRDPELFWEKIADTFEWEKKWDDVLRWDFISGKTNWFINGKLNITVNCLDRHLQERGDEVALIWEPNHPEDSHRQWTYKELYDLVCQVSHGFWDMGIRPGDCVCLYMPMIPQAMIAMLACARIGAIHSVVFAGFSALSLADRIHDAGCKWVVCADHNRRGAKTIPVKAVVDEAVAMHADLVEKVIVYKNTGEPVDWFANKDVWWNDIMPEVVIDFPPVIIDSEDPLFILYTSGSTGKPKGVVHSSGGYMVYVAYSFLNVFQYDPGQIFWCTADIGWITGHSYLIYGPLLAGATTLMFEGIPQHPDPSRFWQIIDKHSVNIFYTAPTAIRSLMAAGNEYAEGHDLSSLKVLGTVGEPINAEAWHWYHDKIGKGKIPVVDTWWQTETGGILISPLAGITDCIPCHASYPLPGIQPILVDTQGKEIMENEVEGLLCIRFPWPSIIRTTYNDHERCRLNYFSAFPGLYFTGDGARRDASGRYRIIGRVDDVINVSGHRLGTAEIENAINEHPDIVESAVVGYPHPLKGQGVFAFLICISTVQNLEKLQNSVNQLLAQTIGPIVKADQLMIVSGLPKTRSGKIMRRVLRKIVEKDFAGLGDITTLLNPEVVEEIITRYREMENRHGNK